MVRKKRLIKLVQALISIDSQNPVSSEKKIGGFVKRYLESLGLRTKVYEFQKDRFNVVARLGNKKNAATLLLTPHLDTVPAGKGWTFNPFSGTVRNGKIYGLGATDCKGNLACGIEAIHSLIEEKRSLGYNVIYAATADEESGSRFGLLPLLEKGILSCDAALVLDSDDFEIIVAQKGLLHCKVRIKGKKAHGAYPHRGVNAIDRAVRMLGDLKKYNFSFERNKFLRPPTMNIGTIRGGDKVNIVADWCEFETDIRFLPGMSAQEIIKDVTAIFRKTTRNFTLEVQGVQKPYQIDTGHPLVKGYSRSLRKLGIAPRLEGSEGATTISFFQKKKIPAIATGFGSSGCAHTVNEYARIDNLHKGSLVLEEFLKTYNERGENGGDYFL